MKKIFIIILCFILVGCTNTISLDFGSKVDANIKFSFTENEFIKHEGYDDLEGINISEDIDAIINEARPIQDNYDELFKEVKFKENNGKYEGEYEYTYTYDDFINNGLLSRCFEYAAVVENKKKIYVYLKGSSECAPLELKVKANGRMLENNAMKKKNNEYIWTVKKDANDIYFNISKSKKIGKIFSFANFFYILLAAGSVYLIIYLKKKTNK